uniref:YbhB/YbcL family Raf kinase inhibitor-like protein n=1 Tax=Attheya septentrionalis TaxID=420275 RepID=A0A7S2UPS4_9STRA|mmetsp:Transcript_7487/g.13480  ORF Transcript_7487/g.13480 Transcript_7487/m.13480 type:complete len:178 (+) Transcript_7487:141-674(+)
MSIPYDAIAKVPTFTLTSTDVTEGCTLANPQLSTVFGSGGDDVSPQLSWEGFPAETKSFVVTLYDPDAPTTAGFWHWAVADIPVSCTSLPTNAGDKEGAALPTGSFPLKNDGGVTHFVGAAPPQGHGKHAYHFAVHAVDVETLGLDKDTASPSFLGFNLHFHTLARAVMTCYYEAKE